MSHHSEWAARFWSKVDFGDGEGCWEWTAYLSQGPVNWGYGQFFLDGAVRKAHRLAYEFCVGPIPAGLVIDHLCRVRKCVRPEHLEAVTTKENNKRLPRRELSGFLLANSLKTHCLRGHEFTAENTYAYRGDRYCRTCHRMNDARRYAERSGKAEMIK